MAKQLLPLTCLCLALASLLVEAKEKRDLTNSEQDLQNWDLKKKIIRGISTQEDMAQMFTQHTPQASAISDIPYLPDLKYSTILSLTICGSRVLFVSSERTWVGSPLRARFLSLARCMIYPPLTDMGSVLSTNGMRTTPRFRTTRETCT